MIIIREAGNNDNEELLALTGVTPMRGPVSLRIDRGPDFFRLLKLRGEGKVLAAVKDQRIIGCVSVTFQQVNVDNKIQRIAYLADLKVHPFFFGSRAALQLLLECQNYIKEQHVDLIFSVVARGNKRVISMLTQGKFGFPTFVSLGRFLVHQIIGSPVHEHSHLYEILEGNDSDIPEICRLCNDFNKSYQLAPLKTGNDFRYFGGVTGNINESANEPALRILTARDPRGREIMATLCSFDAGHLKQNVVTAMPKLLRLGVNVLRFSSKILPFYTFPRVGEAIPLLYLRNVAFKEGHRQALQVLLQRVRRDVFQKRYSFVTIGIHEHDPLRFLVRGLPRYTFVAEGYIGSLSNDRGLLRKISAGIPMEDFTLV